MRRQRSGAFPIWTYVRETFRVFCGRRLLIRKHGFADRCLQRAAVGRMPVKIVAGRGKSPFVIALLAQSIPVLIRSQRTGGKLQLIDSRISLMETGGIE